MGWVDMLLLAIVAVSTIVGIWRGFVIEVMSLAVWVAAFWLAFAFGDEVSALFDVHVATPSLRLLLGYALLFFGALIVGGLATWLMGRIVQSTGLSGTDRMLGLGFGLLRGVALGCVLVLVLGFTPLPQDPWWQQSRLLPGFQRGAEWLRSWLPEAVARHIRYDGLQALPDALPDGLPGLPVPALPGAPTGEAVEREPLQTSAAAMHLSAPAAVQACLATLGRNRGGKDTGTG